MVEAIGVPHKDINFPLVRRLQLIGTTFHQIKDEAFLRIKPPPAAEEPLENRLRWASRTILDRRRLAERSLCQQSDAIRRSLLPQLTKERCDVFAMLCQINQAHLGGFEHLVFDSAQADSYLDLVTDNSDLDSLGGVIRSPGMPVNIFFGGNIFRCPSYEQTPGLLSELAKKADWLFPYEGENELVTEESVYHFLSAIQLGVALTHPFAECNGRTSEDVIYGLWARREDLASTQRYLSFDGSRIGKHVTTQETFIRNEALDIVKKAARAIGLAGYFKDEIVTDYPTLFEMMQWTVLGKSLCVECGMAESCKGLSCMVMEGRYDAFVTNEIRTLIENMGDFNSLQNHPAVNDMARNLSSASPVYHYS